jgi:glycosyltransferase involved in cell wall biosynthesis
MKKNICIFIGYTSFKSHHYGTELAITNLASTLSKFYNVYIVTLAYDETFATSTYTYIYYRNLTVKVDILIISRYINYFTYCFYQPCTKIYLWVHDTHLLDYFRALSFEENGKALLHNVLHKIDKIIVLSEWHKSFFQSYYNIPDTKIKIIGNGIHTNHFLPVNILQKQKNRFIWTSALNRGIERCIQIIQIIQKTFPDTELHIFRDYDNYDNLVEITNEHIPFVHFHGKVSNSQVINEFKKSDFWLYPTTFHETYCISALEAQMSGCIAIATDIGSLNTTVGNHGLLINNNLSEEEIAVKVMEVMKNEPLKNMLRHKGQKWARQQDWDLITKQWLKLFRKYYYFFT